ncbi:RNA polymerase sigma-B factor [Streptacidiphilus sp. MAP12-16]|uniref:RNA polymerase sigma factor SigF n=1 Tax=Streptacidiphilus sp. MAP12-16 TaxID=3156300 RepID=UPI0035189181
MSPQLTASTDARTRTVQTAARTEAQRPAEQVFQIEKIDNPSACSPADARALSKALFARLREAEEGTAEYSYVRGTLIELNLSLVKFAARRYRTRSEPIEDIIQVGTIGLIKAIDRFDLDFDVEFTTFALPTISGEIKRFFRDTSWMVHVPRRLQELRLALAKAGDELEQQLDHSPTPADFAAHLDLTEAEVIEGMTAGNAYTPHSLDATSGYEDDGAPTIVDHLLVDDPAFEAVLHHETLKPLIAGLPERDRAILSMRFGADMTQHQIGEALGVSQMHVSRLLAHILQRLRTGLLAED